MLPITRFGFNHFNSQPHKEADGKYSWRKGPLLHHFNSQPHKEADCGQAFSGAMRKIISTHSLTRRLTAACWLFIVTTTISTHSLTRRLT